MATKQQTQVRLEPDVLTAGKEAASARGLTFNRYVEQLIEEDTTGVRGRGMEGAQRLIDTAGSFLDGLEADLDAEYVPISRDAAA